MIKDGITSSAIDTASVGTKTFSVVATDKAGNQNTKTVTSTVVSQQKISLSGIVYQRIDNKGKSSYTPLVNATVTILGRRICKTARTDARGYYEFKDLPQGAYLTTAYKCGYTFEAKIIRIAASQGIKADFYLKNLFCR